MLLGLSPRYKLRTRYQEHYYDVKLHYFLKSQNQMLDRLLQEQKSL